MPYAQKLQGQGVFHPQNGLLDMCFISWGQPKKTKKMGVSTQNKAPFQTFHDIKNLSLELPKCNVS